MISTMACEEVESGETDHQVPGAAVFLQVGVDILRRAFPLMGEKRME